MATHDPDEPPRMTEPDTIPARFATVVRIEVNEHYARIVALDDFQLVGYNGPERRIVSRLILPIDTARALLRDLRKALHKGAH